MKHMLSKAMRKTAHFLLRISSRLDSRSQNIYIDVENKVFHVSNNTMLKNYYIGVVNGMIEKILIGMMNAKKVKVPTGLELGITDDIRDINPADIEIVWMNYKENYYDDSENPKAESLESLLSKQFVDDDDDDDEEVSGSGSVGGLHIFPIGQMQNDQYHNTPWGQFLKTDMHSPINRYDLQIAHFKGFSMSDMPDVGIELNRIDGLAGFFLLDKHTMIIAPAKYYSATDIKMKVQNVIFEELGISKGESVIAKSQSEWIAESAEIYKSGVPNYICLLPNGNVEVVENFSDNDEKMIMALHKTFENAIIIKNGEIINE